MGKFRPSALLSFVGCGFRSHAKIDGTRRVVYCDQPQKHAEGEHAYQKNYISTTKYNLATFFPKCLFEQFRRVANIYFAVAAGLGFTPLSPYQGASLVFPLVFVIGVSMVKEAYEDYRRWIADQEVNKRHVLVHAAGGKFEEREWRSLRVGEVVRVVKDAYFPADLLLLSSSYEDGVCFVETMNLDGETNLKLRKALDVTSEVKGDGVADQLSEAKVECELPNASLYKFVGNLIMCGETMPLSPHQILLRDSKLRNTEFIFGVCVYTGSDSKIMQNARAPPSKRSKIELRMDSIIFFLFAIMVTLCTAGPLVFGLRTHSEVPSWWYLRPDNITIYYDPSRAVTAAILQAVSSLILYSYLIPISLYVSIEIVKFCQVFFIANDLDMYYAPTDMPAKARTSNLNEELGQVDTILSDKTGTLTCNQMEFLKCSIAGTAYGRGVTEVQRATAKRLNISVADLLEAEGGGAMLEEEDESVLPSKPIKGFALKDSRLLKGAWAQQPHPSVHRMFIRVLGLCHTAIPEIEEGTGEVKYEAESPDEAAFVVTARQLGFEFYKKTQTAIFLREPGEGDGAGMVEREYRVLHILEFNSTRKRMSVIVQPPEGPLLLLCKGADSVVFARLAKDGRQFLEPTRAHLGSYGDAGLRTLCLAYRELDASTYQAWEQEYQAAKTSLGPDRDDLIETACDKIEQKMVLLGATAVEDKLQEGVPETIDKLAQAGLKVWVLTGDKLETAINIGYACSLLREGMEQVTITLDSPEVRSLEEGGDAEALQKFCLASVAKQVTDGAARVAGGEGTESVFALVIDGQALEFALDPALKAVLLAMAMRCVSCICCRVSPKQKMEVTRLVRQGTGKVTLGIGDGANDVGMIQEADIGVGISGVEGQQAVMASDFAIAQFRFLDKLLLVHGHWCYRRIANMVTYFFYKNLAFGFGIFFYNAYAEFSGQIMYNSWFSASYNVFFTSLPVLALGILEQDVKASFCRSFPELYQQGVGNVLFTWTRILTWMLNGVYVSVVTFWFAITAMTPQAGLSNGFLPELPGMGLALYTGVVYAVNIQIFLTLNYVTWIHHICIWGSIAFFFLFALVYGYTSAAFSTTAYYSWIEVDAPSALYWFVSLLLPAAALLPYFVYKTVQLRFRPMDHNILQEIALKRGGVDDPKVWAGDVHLARPITKVGFTAQVEAVAARINRQQKKMNSRERSFSPKPKQALAVAQKLTAMSNDGNV